MFICPVYNNKSKVILLKCGHYKRVVELDSDDIDRYAQMENKLLSILNSSKIICCCNNNNILDINDDYTNGCDADINDTIITNKIINVNIENVDKESIENELNIDMDGERCNLESVDNEICSQIKNPDENNQKILKIYTIKTKSDAKDDDNEDINVESGVSVLFYINSKDSPIEVIAKINSEKGIITIERESMTRFFPIKLITKLVSDNDGIEKYKEKLYNDKTNLNCCIVIHAKNFQHPIGIEFKNKLIKEQFINKIKMDKYNIHLK